MLLPTHDSLDSGKYYFFRLDANCDGYQGNSHQDIFDQIKEDYEDGELSYSDIQLMDRIEGYAIPQQKIEIEKGVFLTRQDAQWHLELNKHHYSDKAHTYEHHAWRSPQYEFVIDFINSIK